MEAILIDLDNVSNKPHISEDSIMYNIDFPKVTMYNWRQYKLLLIRMMDGNVDNYHTSVPDFPANDLRVSLKNCFMHGAEPNPSHFHYLIQV